MTQATSAAGGRADCAVCISLCRKVSAPHVTQAETRQTASACTHNLIFPMNHGRTGADDYSSGGQGGIPAVMSKSLDLDRSLSVARDIAARAADLLREGHNSGFVVEHKSEVDLVTEYDRRSEEMMVAALTEAFPDHSVISEEGTEVERQGSEVVWYVDPLDGTTNFAHGLFWYGVCLGMEVAGVPTVAVVAVPEMGWELWAVRGRGAYQDGQRLQVSQNPTLVKSLVATGFPYDRSTSKENNLPQFNAVIKRIQGIRRMGVASLDCAHVAGGKLDAYWEMKLKPWDTCAGSLLVTEAGGRVTDLDGSPFDSRSGRILATNGLVHDELLEALGEAAKLRRSNAPTFPFPTF